jgi:hypothetical protein
MQKRETDGRQLIDIAATLCGASVTLRIGMPVIAIWKKVPIMDIIGT